VCESDVAGPSKLISRLPGTSGARRNIMVPHSKPAIAQPVPAMIRAHRTTASFGLFRKILKVSSISLGIARST
jgi:hypothetical protein